MLRSPFVFLTITALMSLPTKGEGPINESPADTGTVRFSPSLGVLDDFDDEIMSFCDDLGPQDIEFRRGFIEFNLQNLGFDVAQATLTLTETGGSGSLPVPPILHELAYYPADLVVDTSDLNAPTTPITTFETDDNISGEVFSFDVTDAVRQAIGANIGFRVKLAVDPTGPCGVVGTKFNGLNQGSPPVLTLVPVTQTEVTVDLMPSQCPNPLNVYSHKLMVAINGSESFDAATIDPDTIRMYGVAPMRSHLRDVSAPFYPFQGKDDLSDCLSDGRDGIRDLVLTFDTRKVVAAIESFLARPSGLLDGEIRVLGLSGRLRAEAGGAAIVGEDIVVIDK